MVMAATSPDDSLSNYDDDGESSSSRIMSAAMEHAKLHACSETEILGHAERMILLKKSIQSLKDDIDTVKMDAERVASEKREEIKTIEAEVLGIELIVASYMLLRNAKSMGVGTDYEIEMHPISNGNSHRSKRGAGMPKPPPKPRAKTVTSKMLMDIVSGVLQASPEGQAFLQSIHEQIDEKKQLFEQEAQRKAAAAAASSSSSFGGGGDDDDDDDNISVSSVVSLRVTHKEQVTKKVAI